MTTIKDRYDSNPLTDKPAADDVIPLWDESAGQDRPATYDILVRDPLRQAIEAQTGGRITVLYDDLNQPSYMHVLPRFRYEDLGFDAELGTGTCTAFLVDGVAKSEIFLGVYAASVINARACSLPFVESSTNINWDEAQTRCTDKGAGWHMMTMHEWAAVALWCAANGFQPRGNTDDNRAHDATHEVGVATAQDSGRQILTGSGPATWRHDATHAGIADLVGNVWEWQSLMKLVDGRVFAAPDNDYALAEAGWQDTGIDLASHSNDTWNNTVTAGNQLTDRLLITHGGIDLQGSIWTDLDGERVPRRGGNRHHGSLAGLAALRLNHSRSSSSVAIGFRPAFVA